MSTPTQVALVKAPDMNGAFGRAWKVSQPDESTPDYAASLGGRLVEQPSGHSFWRFHMVGAVHLREQPGVEKPRLAFDGATHEFICRALDPHMPLPIVDRWEGASMMMPLDFVHQVVLPNDENATEMLDLVVRHALLAGLALDWDTRSAWNSILDKMAEHYWPGGHGD